MKRIMILALVISSLALSNAFAQVNGYGARGVLALPSGDFGDVAGTGFGAIGMVLYGFNENLNFSGSAGYIAFGGKENTYFNTEGYKYSYALIPITTGARYYFGGTESKARFYAGGELGYFIYSVNVDTPEGGSAVSGVSSTGKFGLTPQVGVELSILDIRAAYSLADFNYIGLEVGVILGRK